MTAAPAFAATCIGGGDRRPESYYWELRQDMCSNSACEYQKACTVSHPSVTYMALQRSNYDGKKGFPDCWDATENIITQCIRHSGAPGGEWRSNGQRYVFQNVR
ncbi:hypothetical protein B0O99DRAFT_695854 [Bisporella sp. PMI_857]|nr:hypothetical protein B0O99DRAFT_695854 [Bisporella sp. PMI_857]